MSSQQDRCYVALLGLAEYFRTSNPPNIRHAIQCLQALFTFQPPLKMEARTHFQLAQILMNYTKNIDMAKGHLEKGWHIAENLSQFDDVKFEIATLLSSLYLREDQSGAAKVVLRKALELSQHNIQWHCKLLFQLAQIHSNDKEYAPASTLLAVGVDTCDDTSMAYLKTLFLLSRAMILMIERKTQEVHATLNQAVLIIDNSIQNVHLKEYLKLFFLTLQVLHYLQIGQVKTVKSSLKQLQQSIQTIMAPNWPSDDQIFGNTPMESFMWLPKDLNIVLVYLVTVWHSMMAGYMDKAQKYTEKALSHIEVLKSQENKPILAVFQIILLEHIIMCRLVMGNKSLAIQEIGLAKDVCLSSPNKALLKRHSPQLHCLLGLYAMSISLFDNAEKQFQVCLQETTERDLKLFANLNLAIVYLRTHREQELQYLLQQVQTDTTTSNNSQALVGSFYYVQGLNAFHKSSFHEAKRFLRETLKMANAEDLNRLTSCSLVLLSHVFLSINNSRESMNMVTPALQLASKIPDINVQLWGTAILKELYMIMQERGNEEEAYKNHVTFSQNLLSDQYRAINQQPEHRLINWYSGDPPPPFE
uniref:MAU2 chromatid cohesion factor homolog n=1 Tax=Culicoides sonorensis TaxID=179676 RepID=A0A336N1N3_CULSO